MVIRELRPADREAIGKLHSMCYLSELTQEDIDRFTREGAVEPIDGFGAFTDEGELMSVVLNNRLQMNFDGKRYQMAGVGGVATHPAHRRGGAVRELIWALLTKARAEGVAFSGLYPFSHPFYRKFGYEFGRTDTAYTIGFDQLKPYAADIDARLMLPGDDYSPLLSVYEAYIAKYNLAIARDIKRMTDMLKSDPYKGNKYTYAIDDGGELTAYVSYTREHGDDENILAVKEFAFKTHAGFRMILGFLYRLGAEFGTLRISLPDDIPLSALVPEPYKVTTSINSNYMIRALDCRRALEGMSGRGGFDGQEGFVIDIRDDFLPVNSGRYRVSSADVAPTDAPADVFMSVQAFSQLVSGYLSFDSALLRADVRCVANADAPRRVFCKKPIYTGVYF